jgi:hypothetical protein
LSALIGIALVARLDQGLVGEQLKYGVGLTFHFRDQQQLPGLLAGELRRSQEGVHSSGLTVC